MKKIIVTGGLGFIGSNVAKHFARENMITIVDDLNKEEKKINQKMLSSHQLISKNQFINNLNKFSNYDCIIHVGACSDTTNYDEKFMIENNYNYSKKIIDFAVNNKINFIFSSSASVYGDGSYGFKVDQKCERPLNIYAKSKLLVDNYLRDILCSGIDIQSQLASLRYFNVYGFSECHKGKMASVPFHFFNQIKSGQNIKIFEGSKSFFRDFINVLDIVKLINFLYENSINGIYNAGTGQERSFLDMALITQKIFKDVKIEYIKFPEELKSKYQKFTRADISNLKTIGYNCNFLTLEEGLKKYFTELKKYYE